MGSNPIKVYSSLNVTRTPDVGYRTRTFDSFIKTTILKVKNNLTDDKLMEYYPKGIKKDTLMLSKCRNF